MLRQGYRLSTQPLADGAFMAEAIPVSGTRSGPGRRYRGPDELEAARRALESLTPEA
jgi:hypothetical protein